MAVDVPVPSARGSSTHVMGFARGLGQMGSGVFVISRRTSSLQPALEKFDGFILRRIYRGILFPLVSPAATRASDETQRGTVLSRLYRMYLSTVLAFYSGVVAARIIKANRLSVVIERETSYGAGALASILTGTPLILEANGPSFSSISSRRASRIVSYSYALVGEGLKGKTTLIDSGVDADLFKPDGAARRSVRSRLGIGDVPVIGYVGTFQPWHGVDDLVEASQVILKAHPSAKFLMVGPGSEAMGKKAARMGVSDSFLFTGSVPHEAVPQYINAADILVSPANPQRGTWTRTYGTPTQVKVFEYMACRKPVVVTATGPMQRLVKHEETGLLVPPGDKAALAEAICRLLEDSWLADSVAGRGYQMVLEKYTWSEHAREVFESIRSALEA